ncbi:hypothetical protein Fmac_032528 [Flemingia macrophylla]|uniref:Uncharacterized protein n=1 Tax=Flemingia macrophylla TaxID=520843 RepID=A0ABD1L554_9FABA
MFRARLIALECLKFSLLLRSLTPLLFPSFDSSLLFLLFLLYCRRPPTPSHFLTAFTLFSLPGTTSIAPSLLPFRALRCLPNCHSHFCSFMSSPFLQPLTKDGIKDDIDHPKP